MIFVTFQLQICLIILFLIAIHQKRSIFKNVIIIVYSFTLGIGAMALLTQQQHMYNAVVSTFRDHWNFLILIGPSGVLYILFMSKMVENQRSSLLQLCYDRTKVQREYQTILENLDSGILT
jgi:hypothetical protein